MKFEAGSLRYYIGVGFALCVFFSAFYGLVLYEYALNDITQGFLISVGTLSAQFVFGEALASSVGRRAQQSFEAGSAAGSAVGSTVTAAGADTVTVDTPNVGRGDTDTTTGPPPGTKG